MTAKQTIDKKKSEQQATDKNNTAQTATEQAQAEKALGRDLAKTDVEKAIQHYEKALALDPSDAKTYVELARLLTQSDQVQQKRTLLEAATQINPNLVEAHNNLGTTLVDNLDKPDEAIACFRRAIEIKPDFAAAWVNLGYALKYKGLLAEAKPALEKAIELTPKSYSAQINYSSLLYEQEDFPGALKHAQLAAEASPELAGPHINIGTAYLDMGEVEKAKQSAEHALTLEKDNPLARTNLAGAQHLLGDWENAWKNYESRWDLTKSKESVPVLARPIMPQPIWEGQPVNRTQHSIIVYAEQGLGDVINFMRYLPMVAARFNKVAFFVHPELYRLVRASLNPRIDVYPNAQVVEIVTQQHFDWQCPLLSLPRAFGTTTHNAPNTTPYITIPYQHNYKPKQEVGAFRQLRVGLCNAGNPNQPKDNVRSIALEMFNPILNLPAIEWHHLNHGAQEVDARLKPTLRYSSNFVDTAEVIDGLDLIISVDTSIAHLAGALNRPVWLLNRFSPDWRWGLKGEKSVWYPSMRQFRQTKFGDWVPVINAVKNALVKEFYAHADSMLARTPENTDALHIKGIALAIQNNPLAEETILAAARSENGTGEMWINLAKFMASRGDKAAAIKYLKERLETAPDDAPVMQLLAEISN